MTTTEIWQNLNRITPKKPVYELACSMASLDTQTVLELIDKYKQDQELTQEQISNEIHKQRIRKANEL